MHKVGDVAVAIVIVAGIMVLVRPGSKGPQLVSALGNGFASAIGAATGGRSGTGPQRTGKGRGR
jgi:drug/metabolite transporter (DMT)-like permease